MDTPIHIMLQSKRDDYSYQVFTQADSRFWFRLVREPDRDIVTDFFLGSFARTQSSALLVECYRTLGLIPRMTIVFRDILSGGDLANPKAVKEAEDLYTTSGKFLLSEFGFEKIVSFAEESLGKCNLVLVGRGA